MLVAKPTNNRTIGILSALDKESSPLRIAMQETESYEFHNYRAYCGTVGRWRIISMSSGVGKVRAAASAQCLIDHFLPQAVIYIGAAGAIAPDVNIGDIVVSKRLFQIDFDISGIASSSYRGESWIETDKALIKGIQEALSPLPFRLGSVLTADQAVTDTAKKQMLYAKYKADCIDMESAATAITCMMNSTPFAAIRQISDAADESARQHFQTGLAALGVSISSIVVNMLESSSFTFDTF